MKDLKNKLTEEEFNELYEFCKCCKNISDCYKLSCIDCKRREAKQSGIIRKSALEEARDIQIHNIPGNTEIVYFKEVKEKLDLYEKAISEAKSRPLSETVIKAREKTDEIINIMYLGVVDIEPFKINCEILLNRHEE
jgi:hypothetical protein